MLKINESVIKLFLALLNLSVGYKENDMVIFNPNNYKENMKVFMQKSMYLQIHYTHMYTNILSKHRARNSFMTDSFLFNIKNKSFRYRVISLVQ